MERKKQGTNAKTGLTKKGEHMQCNLCHAYMERKAGNQKYCFSCNSIVGRVRHMGENEKKEAIQRYMSAAAERTLILQTDYRLDSL